MEEQPKPETPTQPEKDYVPKSRAQKAIYMKAIMDMNPTAAMAFMMVGATFGFIVGFIVGWIL